MKKLLISAFLTVAATATFFNSGITAQAKSLNDDSFYPQTFIVSKVDQKNDIMELRTFGGFIFTWEGVEDWSEGDIASAIMYDNNTEDIRDDEIIKLHYSGWIY